MAIDFSLFANIAEKVGLVVVGAGVSRFMERRPRVVVFYGHVGEFHVQGPQSGIVHTHTVVIRNSGRLTAHNVRVGHIPVPPNALHIYVAPAIAHNRNQLPGGGEDFVFPTLVPGEQITISYLYFPPLTFQQINLPIRSDEGMARPLNVLPTPQLPRWFLAILWSLVAVGAVSIIYAFVEVSRRYGFF